MTNKAAEMSTSKNVAYPVFIVSHFSTLSLCPEHDLIQYFPLQLKWLKQSQAQSTTQSNNQSISTSESRIAHLRCCCSYLNLLSAARRGLGEGSRGGVGRGGDDGGAGSAGVDGGR